MATDEHHQQLIDAFQSLSIPKNHITVGISNLIATNKQIKSLFINRRLPNEGWSNVQIQHLLFLLSTLDTNNKQLSTASTSNSDSSSSSSSNERWCGVGEREGRVFSSLVAQRHYGLSHGMGRSGDITEPQPKAVGSSVLVKLTLLLVLDVIRRGSGFKGENTRDKNGPASHGILLPLCTGMSMSLLLSSLRNDQNQNKSIVLWSRIDQKSCFKAIQSAGFICVVVPTLLDNDQVVTDINAMKQAIQQHGVENILAIITTTSCFAPRVPDQVDEVAKLCQEHDIHHIINNAYGLQCTMTSKLINRACVVGRVDGIVCSTDKNFLVPVGGAIVLSPNPDIIATVGKVYAGRASSSPIVDLFITLLSMGLDGYKQLLLKRQELLSTFCTKFQNVAEKYGERFLSCPSNTISFGITLDGLAPTTTKKNMDDNNIATEAEYLKSVGKDISSFGSMLFSRCVSGTRVVPRAQCKSMGGQEFIGFGSSVHNYQHAYMTAACAIGLSQSEMDEFFIRLDKCFKEFHGKKKKKESKQQQQKEQEK